MAKSTTASQASIRAKVRKQKTTQKYLQIGLIVFGVLLLILSGYLIWAENNVGVAGRSYRPEDVVYGLALHAIHEMDGPKLDRIPFLPKGGPQPKIAVSETLHSFGTLGPKDIVTYDFVIFNQGEAPLTISRAYTTCGCTVADFTAAVIPPGKVVIMTLTFDAGFHDVSGQTVRRGVIIENNDPDTPQMEIWVQAAIARQ